MLPLGYSMKRIWPAPPGFGPPHVCDVYAVSDCISQAFDQALEVRGWNEHGFYDSPEDLRAFAAQHALPLDGYVLFYYEAHEFEHVDGEPGAHWRRFAPDTPTTVQPPSGLVLAGFDVVALFGCDLPGCSPLSCNGLARELATNEHCLFSSLEAARLALEAGTFANSEPGPYRIIAVYSPQQERAR